MTGSDVIIFVVDDDSSVLKALSRLLRSAGYRVETFTSAREFLDHSRCNVPCLLVLDIRMPDLSGFELQKLLTASGVNIPVIFITACDETRFRNEVREAGALACLHKPFEDHALLEAIRLGIERINSTDGHRQEISP